MAAIAALPTQNRETACKSGRFGAEPIQTVEAAPGSDRNEMVVGLGSGLASAHISFSPPHGRGTRVARIARWGEDRARPPGTAPISSELRHHTAYPD